MSEHITLYEPDEMIIMCKPSIPLVELDAVLKQNGQWIATLLPDERDDRTLGEALINNAYHPRARFGSPLATSVLGGIFEAFDGKRFKSGSRVVKSVAGYDTHRAYVGSEGKLFKAIELTLKVMPRPKTFLRFLAPTSSRQALLQRKPLILEEWQDQLLVEFAGEAEDIAEDHAWLASIAVSEIGDEWGEMTRVISQEKTNALRSTQIDAKAQLLLDSLRERINS